MSKVAVVGWGRGMGHKGHMLLASAVIYHAKQLNATPVFILSKTSLIDPSTGDLWADKKKVRATKDDPLTPQEKLAIYQKTFPDNAKIFTVADEQASTLNDLLPRLAQQGFTDVVLVVGEDQKQAFQYLVNPTKDGSIPYQTMGLQSMQVISRQDTKAPGSEIAGPRATPMREVLLKPDEYRKSHPEYAKLSDEQMQYAVWRDSMPDSLSSKEVFDLMTKAKDRLGRAEQIAPPRAGTVKELYAQIKPMLENVTVEKKAKVFRKMMEIAFLKLGKKLPLKNKSEEESNQEVNLGYEHYFKPEEESNPQPKVYKGWKHYDNEHDKDKEIEESELTESTIKNPDYLEEK